MRLRVKLDLPQMSADSMQYYLPVFIFPAYLIRLSTFRTELVRLIKWRKA